MWYIHAMTTTVTRFPIAELLRPVERSLTPDFARKRIGIKADRKIQARVALLARKCNDGTITPREEDEYRDFVTTGSIISHLQAQAKLLLKNGSV